jgi:hypothetical protein
MTFSFCVIDAHHFAQTLSITPITTRKVRLLEIKIQRSMVIHPFVGFSTYY